MGDERRDERQRAYPHLCNGPRVVATSASSVLRASGWAVSAVAVETSAFALFGRAIERKSGPPGKQRIANKRRFCIRESRALSVRNCAFTLKRGFHRGEL